MPTMTRRQRVGVAAAVVAMALLLFGRYALGKNEDLGAMFYVVAPLALFGCLIATGIALALLPHVWRAMAAFSLAVAAAFFTYSPGTEDGEHAVMFGVYVLAMLFVAAVAARRVRSAPPTEADATQRSVADAILVVSGVGLAVMLGAGALLAVLLILLARSGYGG